MIKYTKVLSIIFFIFLIIVSKTDCKVWKLKISLKILSLRQFTFLFWVHIMSNIILITFTKLEKTQKGIVKCSWTCFFLSNDENEITLWILVTFTYIEKTQNVNRKMLKSSRRRKLLLEQDYMHFMHCLREVRMFM